MKNTEGDGYYLSLGSHIYGSDLIHAPWCPFINEDRHLTYLGKFDTPADAIERGRRYSERPRMCVFCCGKNHPQPQQHMNRRSVGDTDLIKFNKVEAGWDSWMFSALN